MKIRKIIYIVQTSFSSRDYERFGVKIMRDNGFNVEVWDLTPLFECESSITSRIVNYKGTNVSIFAKRKDVAKEVNNLKLDTMVISTFGFDHKILFLFRELSKLGILYSVLYANTIPIYKNIKDNKKLLIKERIVYFIRKIRDLNINKLKKQILTKIPISWLMIKPIDYILAGGSQTVVNYKPPIGKNTKIIWGHTLDYDLYLEDKQKTPIDEFRNKNYAVFVDEYLPFDIYRIKMGAKKFDSPKKYYSKLCKFFEYIEGEIKFEVVIAAHPRSKYNNLIDYFGERSVIYGKTLELIRDAKIVLAHFSTALSFAVLYNKPILFFSTSEMEQSKIDKSYILAYSSSLNKNYTNIDEVYDIDWGKEKIIDSKAYSDYKEKYIKRSSTEEKYFWQIVADEIKS